MSAITETLDRLEYSPGARVLINTMKTNGAFTALVSGGFSQFTKAVKKDLGFNFERSNEIEIINGKFSGELIDPILSPSVKVDILSELVLQLDININETIAVGDGANDIGMLKMASVGVAYHAKPIVTSQTNFRIDHGGLEGLLFLQGFKRDDFVS